MYQDCFYINQTNTTLEQDQLLLQASYFPAVTDIAPHQIGHLYFNLPSAVSATLDQDLDLAFNASLSSPCSDSTTWSSCSSSPSLDVEKVFNFNLQQNDIESFLLSDLPNQISTLEPSYQSQPQPQQQAPVQPQTRLSLEQHHQHPQRQVKAFACCACPRSFARKHDLQRHIRVHTGAKPYSCLNCTKAFARTDALKRHLRMEEACRMSPVIQAMKNTGSRRYRNL
ncbi:inositol polyphosphate kinase kcs1 [Mucor velutinosus]|uniref:Inositol polyphosphate kinase kcs1 n=1 Tax=Mucor velutinosus TaxID=708070 RepID=A0AAN7DNI5_9FUNG|nr:inositol polyphosphate kinase kcs1 [Mucor velutinosus]